MPEIEFTHFTNLVSLSDFQTRSRLQIKGKKLDWASGWPDLLQYALRLEGPDVSEVGMTWLGSLMGMQALRSYQSQDTHSIGGSHAFLDVAWQNGIYDDQLVGVPFNLDTRLFYYRRDILEKMGIDETKAFQTTEDIRETLLRLKSKGVAFPWFAPTTGYTIQFIAPWVWGAGGDIRTSDGHEITLTEPEAIRGMLDYYELLRLMPRQVTEIVEWQNLFWDGTIPILYEGSYMVETIKGHRPKWMDAIGAAPVPGIPYVGGTYLTIWRYCVHEHAALDLIRQLVSLQYQSEMAKHSISVPARLEVLNMPPFTTDPILKVIAQSILKGRTIPNVYRWAGVESRLVAFINQLATDVLSNSSLDLESELHNRLAILKHKLERTILA